MKWTLSIWFVMLKTTNKWNQIKSNEISNSGKVSLRSGMSGYCLVSVIIAGYTNIHLDNLTDHHTIKFNLILTVFGLTHHVQSSTHRCGHLLDILITRSDLTTRSVCVDQSTDVRPLNHHCRDQSSSSPAHRTGPSHQGLLAYTFNAEEFIQHIERLSLVQYPLSDVNELFALHDKTVSCRWTCSAQSIQHSRSFFICPLVQRWVTLRKDQDASPREKPPTDENRWVALCQLAPTVCTSENGVTIPFPDTALERCGRKWMHCWRHRQPSSPSRRIRQPLPSWMATASDQMRTSNHGPHQVCLLSSLRLQKRS